MPKNHRKDAKYTPVAQIRRLYQLLFETVRLLSNYNIHFWLDGDTLLGAIRHNGLLPWANTISIGLLESDYELFESINGGFKKCGYNIRKLEHGFSISKDKNNLLNINVFSQRGEIITDNKFDFFEQDILPISTRHKFGNYRVHIPADSSKYLDIIYGPDWSTMSVELGDSRSFKIHNFQPAQPDDYAKEKKCLHDALCLLPKDVVNIRDTYITSENVLCENTTCNDSFEPYGINMGVYVINCEVHVKRYQKFEKYANAAGLKYCLERCVKGKEFTQNLICEMFKTGLVNDTVEMTPIEIAINLSHYNVWRRSLNVCEDYCLILEDDVEVYPNFVDKVAKIMKALKEKDIKFDVLFLWNGTWTAADVKRKKVLKIDDELIIDRELVEYNAGGVAYILSSNYSKFLIDNFFPINMPQDMFVGEFLKNRTHLTLRMTKKKGWYYSPLLYLEGGGDFGTGADTTQEHDTPTVNTYNCRPC